MQTPSLPTDISASSPATLAGLESLVAADMSKVNSLILDQISSQVTLIPEISRHLIHSGGKRLRPMLTLASARTCGYVGEKSVFLAAAIEFMHTATLLHDDVTDESDMRRGKKAARLLWGNQASILVGDYLLGLAFQMMTKAESMQALHVLSQSAVTIAKGEIWQLSSKANLATTEDEYGKIIHSKTASLFSAATEVGAILADLQDQQKQERFSEFGHNLGMAFQLIDDALDYTAKNPKFGKDIGDDFREQKVTLPIILSYQRSTPEERSFWENTFTAKNLPTHKDFLQAIDLLQKHGAIQDTVTQAKHYAGEALSALSDFPEGEYREALRDVVQFCIQRGH